MLAAGSLICIAMGAAAAAGAKRFPSYVKAIETCGGALFIIGLLTAGLCLPPLL